MRKDLTGVSFRTSSAHDPPFVVVVRDMDLAAPPPGYKESLQQLDINVLCWLLNVWAIHDNHDMTNVGVVVLTEIMTVTSHQKIDDNSSFAPIYIGPSFYGDIWSNLQQTLNFTYNMVR